MCVPASHPPPSPLTLSPPPSCSSSSSSSSSPAEDLALESEKSQALQDTISVLTGTPYIYKDRKNILNEQRSKDAAAKKRPNTSGVGKINNYYEDIYIPPYNNTD